MTSQFTTFLHLYIYAYQNITTLFQLIRILMIRNDSRHREQPLLDTSNNVYANNGVEQANQEIHEAYPFLTLDVMQLKIDKKIKILKAISLIAMIIAMVSFISGMYQHSYLSQITDKNYMQSYQLFNMKTQVEHYKQQIEGIRQNFTRIVQDIRLQVIKIQVDIAKLQSHSKNLRDKTRLQKKEIWDFNNNIKQNLLFAQSKFMEQFSILKHSLTQSAYLPKIIWLYTQFPFQSQKMLEQLLGNLVIYMAKQSQYEVRTVNSWNAYSWLSNHTSQKITTTMQNRVIQEKVDSLLRMALLMQHGGILIKVSETLLIQNFNWVQRHIATTQSSPFASLRNEVLLFSKTKNPKEKPEYQDHFIAAIPRAPFIVDIFDTLCEVISTGQLKFDRLRKAFYDDREVGAKRVRNMTKNIINSIVYSINQKFYSIQRINVDISMFVDPNCRDRLAYLLKRPETEYKAACGSPLHLIHFSSENDRRLIQDQLEWQLSNEVLGADRQGYWHRWMVIKQNRRLFDPLPQREVSYCLIDAHPSSDHEELQASLQRLKMQSYRKWSAVYFVDKQVQKSNRYVSSLRQQGYNITLVKHSGSIGRNYQIGIIKYCPSKSFVFVLRRYQEIEDPLALQVLTGTLAPRQVLGAFLGVEVNEIISHSNTYFQYYSKPEFNGKQPNYEVLQKILNYLRVFHSDCYKIIPQFDLRTPEGQYFEDRFVFLEQFLFMVRNLTDLHDATQIPHTQRVKWFIKSNADLFDVPNRIILHRSLVVKTKEWQKINRGEIKRNNHKIDSYPMTYNMDHLVQNGIPMSDFAVFNPGLDYQPYTIRNKAMLIPKIIHIIWIQGKIPQTKRIVIQMNKALYPDFIFKIWTKDNITREKFPRNYDLLMTIYNMEKTSRYSKRATMADVLRHQLLYDEGGFYMDTSMVLFNNVFYKWLSYKFVLATERTFRHRWAQSMCIFGVMPRFPGLLRIIQYNNTNRYQLWKRDALEIAGPHNFRWTVRGMQQYDPDYLIMNYETFYPMTYSLPSYWDSYCFTQAQYLSRKDETLMKWKGKYLVKNCGKYYPYSFGKEVNGIGSSWQNAKW